MTAIPAVARPFLAPGVIAIAGLGLLDCLLARTSAPPSQGVWVTVASVAVSPQFLGYVVVPVWLLYCIARDGRSRMPQLLLRSGSHLRMWSASLTETLRMTASATLSVLVVMLLACVGEQLPSNPIKLVIGGSPASVSAPLLVAGEIVMLAIVLVVLRSALLALGAVTGRRWPTVATAVTVWLWIVASLTGAVGIDSPANAARYFDLPSLLAFGWWLPFTLGAALVLGASAASVVALDRRHRQLASAVDPARAAFVAVALAVAALSALAAVRYTHDFGGILTVAFIGNGGTLLSALPALFLWVGYGYAAQVRWSSIGESERCAQLLRHGSQSARAARMLRREARLAVTYVLAVDAVAAATALALSDSGGSNPHLAPWMFQLTANGILAVVMNLVCLFVVTDVAERPVAGTVAGIVLVIASAVWPMQSAWYPFGGGSPARAALGWPGVLATSASMAAVTRGALAIHFLATSRSRKANT